MPLVYTIDEQNSLITLTLSGHVTRDEITGYIAASRQAPGYRGGMHRLVVADGVESFPELPEVRDITVRALPGRPDPSIRIAAVADTPLGLGMIAMFFGHWGLSDRYRLFNDAPTARAWLLAD